MLDPDAFLPLAVAVVTLVTFAVSRLRNLKRSVQQARSMLREHIVSKLGEELGAVVMNNGVNPLLDGKSVRLLHTLPCCRTLSGI